MKIGLFPGRSLRNGTEKYDDYDVKASFDYRGEIVDEEVVGHIQLVENALWQDMPLEIEVNGFTYKIQH